MRQQLADLFIISCSAVERRLSTVGLPLTMPRSRTITERSGQNQWAAIRDEYDTNVLHDNTLLSRSRPWLTGADRVRLGACAESITASAGHTLPFTTMTGGSGWSLIEGSLADAVRRPPQYDLDPVSWVEHFVLLPALIWHMRCLPHVKAVSEAAAQRFADEVLRVVHDDRLRYSVDVPLSGIDMDASSADMFEEAEASLRRLSNIERGEWLTMYGWPGTNLIGRTEPPEVVLELHVSQPRHEQPKQPDEVAPRFITALLLHGHRPGGRVAAERSEPRWVETSTGFMPAALPNLALKQTSLTSTAFRRVIDTAGCLSAYNLKYPRSPRDLALHRFLIGSAREDPADAFLDFTVTLEAMLLPYDPHTRHGDLSYRFRMHGAHYLAATADQRPEILKQLTSIYDMRSKLVHGAKYPSYAEIAMARDSVYEFARRGLFRAVHDGFPKAEDFKIMLLGLNQDEPS